MVNRMILQGRLTADPELRNTQIGTAVCSFRIAWSEKYKETETKLFLSCTAWRGTGEMVAKYFRKGQEIVVEGKLHTENWMDQDGGKHSDIKMTVDSVHFCGPKDGNSSAPRPAAPAPVDYGMPSGDQFTELEEDDGDLPF